MRSRSLVRRVFPYLAAAVFLLPLALMVVGSLRAAGLPPPVGIDLIPDDPTLSNFSRVRGIIPFNLYLRNSLVVAGLAVPITVFVGSMAGFAIRLARPRAQRILIAISLVAMMVPVTAVWGTRFRLFRAVGAIDTLVPLVATSLLATNAFLVLIYAWSMHRISDEQFEAARLDGAGPWRQWWDVAMPQVKPATLAVAVLSFTFHWANFMDPLLYLNRPSRFTLPLGVRLLQQLNPTDNPLLLAGAVMVTLPAVAVFLIGQRSFLDNAIGRLGGGRR